MRRLSRFVFLRLLGRLLLWAGLAVALISCATLKSGESDSAGADYQARLAQGWHYLNIRQHSRALAEFTAAAQLRPDLAEPLHGRANALFNMDRFAETLAVCSELSGESDEYSRALSFCWSARLEISRGAAATKNEVREEIDKLLERAAPSEELLFGAYWGYYHLREQEKRLPLILQLAETGGDSALAGSIAGALFEEIIYSEPGTGRRAELAASYLRNFPEARMADEAAAIVLRDLLEQQTGTTDHWQLAQLVLQGREDHPLLNGAVARWLLDHATGYDQAVRLLEKNLSDLDARRRERPPLFSAALWQQEVESERLLYKYLLGRAWLGQGETARSREILTEVSAARPDWPDTYHFLGVIARAAGETDLAIEYFRTALARGSGRPETTSELRLLLADRDGFSGEPLAYFQAQSAGPRFRDVTAAAGLGGTKAERVAWGDYDQDDDDDLLLDGARLFTNQGEGGFVAAPDLVIPADLPAANGGVWGDYDNDRFPDLFVTSHQGNQLLHNEGGVRFTKAVAWPKSAGRPVATEAAAWGDLNNDGFLDLYVANYEQGSVLRGQCGQDQLFINRGGRLFTESSREVGMVSEEGMCGRGVFWSDLNGDGWQDILVANYRLDPNFLWLNRGDGTVVESAEAAGVQGHEVEGAYGHSIGSVSGDLDGDGDLDVFITNLAHPRYLEFSDQSMVLINNGARLPVFTDRMATAGLTFEETNSDPVLFDVDLDGDLDLYVTSIYPNRPAHLYLNDGQGVFTDLTWLAGAGVLNGWGAATADYDGDGYPDLLVASSEGVRLLHNEGGGNNWLAVRIDDRHCNRFGVGAKVTASSGGQSQVREITAGRGTGSQDSLTVLFGLGGYAGPVEVAAQTLCGETLRSRTTELNRVLVLRP
jgi:tetratricopeptide (TPR) repeat protein